MIEDQSSSIASEFCNHLVVLTGNLYPKVLLDLLDGRELNGLKNGIALNWRAKPVRKGSGFETTRPLVEVGSPSEIR